MLPFFNIVMIVILIVGIAGVVAPFLSQVSSEDSFFSSLKKKKFRQGTTPSRFWWKGGVLFHV